MKRIFSSVLVVSITLGVLSYFPALLFCALMQLDSSAALIYALGVTLLMMITLPIPMIVRFRKESKKIAGISEALGGEAFVWRVGILTKQKPVNGYFGFNDNRMSLVGVMRDREYSVEVQKAVALPVDLSSPPDIVIRTSGNKEYHLLSAQTALIQKALRRLGWQVVEDDDPDED